VTTVNRLLPKLSPNVPAGSFFRFNEETKLVEAIVTPVAGYTSMVPIAWDTCADCTRPLRRCECARGVSAKSWMVEAAEKRPELMPEEAPKKKLRRMKL